MDYEEKYKTALERAKAMIKVAANQDEAIGFANTIFPELAESENKDERIRRMLIEFFGKGAERNSSTNGISDKDILPWLEKQGKKPQGKSALEAAKEEKVDNANKVEPKFKVGEWITDGYLHCKISDVLDDRYIVDTKFAKRSAIPFKCENNYHLWTIADAKDGDILYSLDSKQPFIYKNRKPFNQTEAYCGINIYGKFFVWNTKDCVITLDKYVPATKEQRDLLFQKMYEAGYMWDSESKQLLSLEAKPSVEKKNAWSEEDKDFMYDTLCNLTELKDKYGEGYGNVGKCIDWLKSFSPQNRWKPSNEQIKALRWVLNNIPYNKHKEEISGLLDQIKDL